MTDVTTRLSEVRARIRVVCKIAERPEESVRLLAVSAGYPAAAIREAYAEGQRDFGESDMNELATKANNLRELSDIRWRFVGHLPHTKTKEAVRIGCTVDSIGSEREAIALNRRAKAAGRIVKVMIRVNLTGEKSKAGCNVPELGPIAKAVRGMECLKLVGLMTVPPIVSEPELARPWYRRLRLLGNQLSLSEFSMGVNDDIEVAIEEGATVVRVGKPIFR
jgi:pyridoxal phosphate enzyme (YggS family)